MHAGKCSPTRRMQRDTVYLLHDDEERGVVAQTGVLTESVFAVGVDAGWMPGGCRVGNE